MVNVEHTRATLHFLPFLWGVSAHSGKDSERWARQVHIVVQTRPTVHGDLEASGSNTLRLGYMITQAPHRTSKYEANWCSRFVLVGRTVIGVPEDAKNECVCDFANRNGWTGRGSGEKNGGKGKK